MRKKIISVAVSLLILCVATSCNGNGNANALPVPSEEPAPVVTEYPSEEISETVSEEVSEEEEAYDPYEALIVTEEWAKKYASPCVIKDGKIYSVGNTISPSSEVGDKYPNIGVLAVDPTDSSMRYQHKFGKDCLVTYGPVPTVHCEGDDLLVKYSDVSFAESITVRSVSFYGYTVGITETTDQLYISIPDGVFMSYKLRDITKYGVTDLEGNEIEDYHSLEYGQKYLFYWYQGTQYNEFEMIADCSYYTISQDTYKIIGTLTKDGYAKYDYSNLEPGYYVFEASGFVQVN